MKLYFEIAVDQQTRTSDRTFRGGGGGGGGFRTPTARTTEPKTICPYMGMRTKFNTFWLINWSNINIFE